jgi:hypothetical protein
MKAKQIIIMAVFIIAGAIVGGFLRAGIAPHKVTYEECIMKAMDGVQSDMAARLKAGACRKMYPGKTSFTHEELFGTK